MFKDSSTETNFESDIKIEICKVFNFILDFREDLFID